MNNQRYVVRVYLVSNSYEVQNKNNTSIKRFLSPRSEQILNKTQGSKL